MRIGGSVSAEPLAVGPHAGASSIRSATTTLGSNTARRMPRDRTSSAAPRRCRQPVVAIRFTSGRSTSRAAYSSTRSRGEATGDQHERHARAGHGRGSGEDQPGHAPVDVARPERARLQHRVAQRPGRATLEPHRLPVERVEAALDDDIGRIAELADAALQVVGESPAVACPVDLAVEVRHRFERVHRRAARRERRADRRSIAW